MITHKSFLAAFCMAALSVATPCLAAPELLLSTASCSAESQINNKPLRCDIGGIGYDAENDAMTVSVFDSAKGPEGGLYLSGRTCLYKTLPENSGKTLFYLDRATDHNKAIPLTQGLCRVIRTGSDIEAECNFSTAQSLSHVMFKGHVLRLMKQGAASSAH